MEEQKKSREQILEEQVEELKNLMDIVLKNNQSIL